MFKIDVIQEYQIEKSDVIDIVRIISTMPKVFPAIFTHTFYAGYTSELVINYNIVALSPIKVEMYQIVENTFKIWFAKF